MAKISMGHFGQASNTQLKRDPLENPSHDLFKGEAVGSSQTPGLAPEDTFFPTSLHTDWGFGSKENRYNRLIAESVDSAWTDTDFPLEAFTFKALVAAESGFKEDAVSRTGACVKHPAFGRIGL